MLLSCCARKGESCMGSREAAASTLMSCAQLDVNPVGETSLCLR
jgi:hypothetical protein